MRVRLIKCGYPSSMHGHWRLPWLERSLCGLSNQTSRSGWNLVDYGSSLPICAKCGDKAPHMVFEARMLPVLCKPA